MERLKILAKKPMLFLGANKPGDIIIVLLLLLLLER